MDWNGLFHRPIEEWQHILRNDFESGITQKEPAVGDVLMALKSSGAAYVQMTGTGSACYGIFTNEEEALAAHANVRRTRLDILLRTFYFGAFQQIHAPSPVNRMLGSQAAKRSQLSVEIHASGGKATDAAYTVMILEANTNRKPVITAKNK